MWGGQPRGGRGEGGGEVGGASKAALTGGDGAPGASRGVDGRSILGMPAIEEMRVRKKPMIAREDVKVVRESQLTYFCTHCTQEDADQFRAHFFLSPKCARAGDADREE